MNDLSPSEIEALAKAMGNLPAKEEKKTSDERKKTSISEPTPKQENGKNIATRLQLTQLKESTITPPIALEEEHLLSTKLKIEVVLGQTSMPLEKILKLHPGNIVELDQLAGESVDLVANGKIVAKAEIVVVEDHFAVRILEIVK